jgi:putative endonuclease
MDRKTFYVYLLASRPHGTIYIGITNDLVRRVYEHRNDFAKGPTSRYHVHRLVHYEEFPDAHAAITREKQLKYWHRAWKIRLIEETNPDWDDLSTSII